MQLSQSFSLAILAARHEIFVEKARSVDVHHDVGPGDVREVLGVEAPPKQPFIFSKSARRRGEQTAVEDHLMARILVTDI